MTLSGGDIAAWLIGEGRLLGDSVAIAEGLVDRLLQTDVPLLRLRIGQRVASPLLSAWGVIWRRDLGKSEVYVVPRRTLTTSDWMGSPFQHVIDGNTSLRKSLIGLHPEDDHELYHEMAEIGGKDFFAMPLAFGDGSVQAMSLVGDGENGFNEDHIHLFESLRHPLAAAMEPVAMHRSMTSLLVTYLGRGPAAAVEAGSIRRGDHAALDAVVMFSDLRGFTEKSNSWSEQTLLRALDGYFDVVVSAVQAHGGDVLKFLGDGILATFPIEGDADAKARCVNALNAALAARQGLAKLNETRQASGDEPIDFGTALHRGEVTYGNIGSPDRLDFTVIGETVNLASRLEGLCKSLGEPVLCSDAMQASLGSALRGLGHHEIHGLPEPVPVFVPI